MHLSVVVKGSGCGFGTVIIPIESVQGNYLRLHPFQQLDLKYLLKETPLFKSNLWTVSSCNKRWLEHYVKE